MPNIVTKTEACKILHLSPQRIEQFSKHPEFPGVRIGRKWVINADLLWDFLQLWDKEGRNEQ